MSVRERSRGYVDWIGRGANNTLNGGRQVVSRRTNKKPTRHAISDFVGFFFGVLRAVFEERLRGVQKGINGGVIWGVWDEIFGHFSEGNKITKTLRGCT